MTENTNNRANTFIFWAIFVATLLVVFKVVRAIVRFAGQFLNAVAENLNNR